MINFSNMTLIFVAVIVLSSAVTLLVTRLTSRLGKVERLQKELTTLLNAQDYKQLDKIRKLQKSHQKAVDRFNTYITNFPGTITASFFGFEQIEDDDVEFLAELIEELAELAEMAEMEKMLETEENLSTETTETTEENTEEPAKSADISDIADIENTANIANPPETTTETPTETEQEETKEQTT
ncbi:MAG: LemA family protein [Defluviitaleaceae bacterium]|nr:LemA family protein [Defluviitaleaceae bacterium]